MQKTVCFPPINNILTVTKVNVYSYKRFFKITYPY